MSSLPRCAYALPRDLHALDRLPSNPGRSSAVHKLVGAFDLLENPHERSQDTGNDPEANRAKLIRTQLSTRSELERFHDPEYVDYLLKRYKPAHSGLDDDSDKDEASSSDPDAYEDSLPRHPADRSRSAANPSLESFGLEHDCPPFPGLAQYVLAVAGAALAISRELREDRADIGIVWDGGRHHAQRSSAAGFCYVNDAALAISELRLQPTKKGRKKLDRILYLDIMDIHHGDGVEQAFWSTSRILTISAHFHDPRGGFYPLTGAVEASGPAPPSPAASHALNIPIRRPGSLRYVCRRTILPLIAAYKPAGLVIQCGVDGLAGDPIGGRLWGFGLHELGDCLETVIQDSLAHARKVLLLGGGGYHTPNVARAWAYFTSIALGRKLDLNAEIPLTIKDDINYGPSYTLDVPQLERPSSATNSGAGEEPDSVFDNDPHLQQVVKELDRHLLVIKNKYSNC